MIDGQHDRFKDVAWYNQAKAARPIIGGAGGIGSWLTLLLARTGMQPIVFDYDRFEPHNMSGQFVAQSQIGMSKVEALADNAALYAGSDIVTFDQKYERGSMAGNYMLSGFDNMEARKHMFESWCNYNRYALDATRRRSSRWFASSEPIFIDGRLTLEQIQIFCVTRDDNRVAEYRDKHLFDDKEVKDEECTLKQTSHTAAIIAGMMTSFLTNHMVNIKENSLAREVPFFTEYFLPLNHMECS